MFYLFDITIVMERTEISISSEYKPYLEHYIINYTDGL